MTQANLVVAIVLECCHINPEREMLPVPRSEFLDLFLGLKRCMDSGNAEVWHTDCTESCAAAKETLVKVIKLLHSA